jgi:hypothetical protein
MAVAKPLYKKREKISMTNYKLISLLTVFSKVLEKVMDSRSSQHLRAKKNTEHTTVQF